MGGLLSGFAGGTIGGAVVKLYLDSKQYQAGLAEAEAKGKTYGTTMGNTFSRLGIIGTAAFIGLSAYAVKFASSAIQGAIEVRQAHDKMANTIANAAQLAGHSVSEFTSLAESIRQLTGVDDEQITVGEALLGQMGLTADQIRTLTPLVVDLSVKNGIDLNSSFKAVGKAALGSTGALARYIGPIQKGSDAAGTYSNVLQKLGQVQGYAAEQAKAEPWKVLESNFQELEQTVGTVLIPVLVRLSDLMLRAGRNIKQVMIPALVALAALLPKIATALGGGLLAGLGGVVESLGGIATLDPAMLASGLAAVGDALSAPTGGTTDRQAWLVSALRDSTVGLVQFKSQMGDVVTLMQGNGGAAEAFAAVDDSLKNFANDTGGSFQQQLDTLNQRFKEAGVNVRVTAQQLDALRAGGPAAKDALAQIVGGVAMATGQFGKLFRGTKAAVGEIQRFAGMTKAALKQWQSDVRSSFDDVMNDLGNLKHNFGVTTKQLERGFAAMADRSKLLKDAMDKINKLKGFNPAFIAYIEQQGPADIVAFAGANKKAQQQMQDEWKQSQGNVDSAKNSVNQFARSLGSIPPRKQVRVDVQYYFHGWDPHVPIPGVP